MRGSRPGWNTHKITIKSVPRPREVYFIGMFTDSKEPEFTGYHPGVIVRGAGSLDDKRATVTFVPLTTVDPSDKLTGKLPPSAYSLSINPNPRSEEAVWAICDHVMTVKVSRLELHFGPQGLVVPKVSRQDFEGILQSILDGAGAFRDYVEKSASSKIEDMKLKIEQIEREAEEKLNRVREQILDEMTSPTSETI